MGLWSKQTKCTNFYEYESTTTIDADTIDSYAMIANIDHDHDHAPPKSDNDDHVQTAESTA